MGDLRLTQALAINHRRNRVVVVLVIALVLFAVSFIGLFTVARWLTPNTRYPGWWRVRSDGGEPGWKQCTGAGVAVVASHKPVLPWYN